MVPRELRSVLVVQLLLKYPRIGFPPKQTDPPGIEGQVVPGNVRGCLAFGPFMFGRWLEKTLRAHQRCINSVHHTAGGLVTGGKDGFVKLWSTQLAHLKTFDLNDVNNIEVACAYSWLYCLHIACFVVSMEHIFSAV